MNDCIKASDNKVILDPKKRLNYEFGMVLGVNDFRQEQEHHEWKHRLSNRFLEGSGTVCGLQITAGAVIDAGNNDIEIRIAPGYAITPKGNWIVVEKDQCGKLNQWLQRQNNESSPSLGAGTQRVYVTLCYDECFTELVPIAGQACASDEESSKPSRIQENFKIEFSWQAPKQDLEDNARAFGELMHRIEIQNALSPPIQDDSELLIELIRTLGLVTSPSLTSPPDDMPIVLMENTACATIRQAMNVWVTEVCPRIDKNEDCLLLAALDFSVDANGLLIVNLDAQNNLTPGTLTIDESERPVLLPNRLKQELFCLIGGRIPV